MRTRWILAVGLAAVGLIWVAAALLGWVSLRGRSRA